MLQLYHPILILCGAKLLGVNSFASSQLFAFLDICATAGRDLSYAALRRRICYVEEAIGPRRR